MRVRNTVAGILVLVLLMAWVVAAQDSTPQTVTIQGYLSDMSSGQKVPAHGFLDMTFDLYDSADGGLRVASVGPLSVEVTDGLYEIELALPVTVFAETERHLEVTVDGETLSPRIPVGNVAYAYVADQLDGFEGEELDESTEIQGVESTLLSEVAILQGQIDGLAATGGNTLEGAYNEGGPGAGRIVNLESGPVRLQGTYGLEVDSRVDTGKLHVIADIVLGTDVYGQRFVLHPRAGSPMGDFLQITHDKSNGDWAWEHGITLQRSTGNVGIGTTSPEKTLDVDGIIRTTARLEVDLTDRSGPAGRDAIVINASDDNTTGTIIVNKPTLRVWSLSDNRDARLRAGVIEITGGADLAEPFDVSGTATIEAGSVMVLDDEHDSRLAPSEIAYDTRVAGIVSGAGGISPGLTLSESGVRQGQVEVAMTGRVYALATAANGAIKPGDLLTTSRLRGHAMRATDMDLARHSVIGKAMSRLEEGEGLVLVLVD